MTTTPEILPEQLARERLEAKQEALDDVEMLMRFYRSGVAKAEPEGISTESLALLKQTSLDEIDRCISVIAAVRDRLPKRPKKL